ncbi:MAG: DNA-directed RNA polymerase subunit F [archaeon]|nr:DNA-directed RNA polymerase subunit F [archaeon]
MIGKKILGVKQAPVFEVREILKERLDENEKGDEPTYEQTMAFDYSKKFAKLTPAKGKKLIEELLGLGLSESVAMKITDILPEDMDELNLLAQRTEKVPEESLKQALELVAKYQK